MNWGRPEDLLCYFCLIGSVATPLRLTQEVAALGNIWGKLCCVSVDVDVDPQKG